MSETIWKYTLLLADRQYIDMPDGARVFMVEMQSDSPGLDPLVLAGPTIWARVDPDAPLTKRGFAIVGTGRPVDDDVREYIGSAMNGPFVWHVFEAVPA